jgi:hypothetical protein
MDPTIASTFAPLPAAVLLAQMASQPVLARQVHEAPSLKEEQGVREHEQSTCARRGATFD